MLVNVVKMMSAPAQLSDFSTYLTKKFKEARHILVAITLVLSESNIDVYGVFGISKPLW